MDPTLLIVDDDIRIHDALRRGLHRVRPNWICAYAENGDAALEKLETMTADVIVTDIDMPGMNGAALLALVAKSAPNMLRIAMSGRYNNLDTYAMTTCSHKFINKPFATNEFIQFVSIALGTRGRDAELGRRRESAEERHYSRDEQRRINRERLRRIGIVIDP